MAGEIEEPLRLNFQADLLHSGSISFGRFESESLSWERRSIFSHNRYLEEVEKYSKPGSVTEKKAYFEAEFRRKALLRQQSSECQDGGECPTSSNSDHHDFEGSGNGNESPCSSHPSECNMKTEIQQHEKGVVEALNAVNGVGSRHAAWFDEIPHNSGYDEEFEDIISREWETQNFELLPVTTQKEPVINMVDCPVTIPEPDKFDETHQSETENLMGNTEQSIGMTHNDVEVNATSEANDSSATYQTLKKDHSSTSSGPRTMFSPKVKSASEKKVTRATMQTQPNIGRSQKLVSNEASKGSMKPRTNETKGLHVKKTEKKLPRPAIPFTCTGIKTSKAEDAPTSMEKELQLRKSNIKDLRSEKTIKARIPSSKNPLPGVPPTINRPKQTISSSKGLVIQNATGFSFKTDQRAENRKEFYMNIAEKKHAKEAEINHVDAKKQEKQAAEMKQFRRSLIFKAKPMPSFYNESARGSDQHKVTPISKTPNQPRPSSQSMPTFRANNAYKSLGPSNVRPSSATSSTNRIRLSDSVGTNQPRPSLQSMATRRGVNNTHKSLVPSNVRPSSATPSTNRIRLSESVGRNHILVKKEQEKKKDTVIKKQKEPETRAIDIVKKHAKGIHLGKSANLAVF